MDTTFAVFDGVGEEVADYLCKSFLVDGCIQVVGDVYGEFESFLSCQRNEAFIGFLQDFGKVVCHKVEVETLGFGLSEIEQLVYEVKQPVGVQIHNFQILFDGIVHMVGNQDVLQRAFDKCQRCAYLMGYVGEEVNLGRVEFALFLVFQYFHGLPVLAQVAFAEITDYICDNGCQQNEVDDVCHP